MIDLISLYIFILGVLVVQFGLIRWRLSRGLQATFTAFRMSGKLSTIFEAHYREYIALIAWTILNIIIAAFVGFRLFALMGLLSLESTFLLVLFILIYAKDLVFYATAKFIMQRVGQ